MIVKDSRKRFKKDDYVGVFYIEKEDWQKYKFNIFMLRHKKDIVCKKVLFVVLSQEELEQETLKEIEKYERKIQNVQK